jgi:anti-sigma factor RsiW
VSCDRERVTAFVDDVLEGAEQTLIETHVAECSSCRAQVAEERALRKGLKGLPAPELPFGLEQKVRKRLRRGHRFARVTRVVLPLAAVLVAALWVRGYAPFVAWELSRDHEHCFGMDEVPAEVWASEPELVAGWFEERGRSVPLLPSSVAGTTLVGGRFCPLPDISFAPHVYYASGKAQVSVFVVPHGVRMSGDYEGTSGGNAVALVRLGSDVMGVVSERPEEVDAFVDSLRTSVARLGPGRLLAPRTPLPPRF